MLNKVINVYKECGQTPLDCINILKKEDESLKFLPMTYAGRLDPLAEGVLLILVGDEVHKKDEYLNLSKEYEVEVLFGFSTDTYDILGKVDNETKDATELVDLKLVSKIIPKFLGKIKQSYPPYSSRPVKGKPLFMWAREGKLDEIEVPNHDVFVESIEIIEENQISGGSLFKKIKEDISKIKGDFRQKEILSLWDVRLRDKDKNMYSVVKLKVSCGSGVYIRGIAHEIGKNLNTSALALKIVRTRVGEYGVD